MRTPSLVFAASTLIFSILLVGCSTYGGPQLTSVMTTTCANQSSFGGFRSCINGAWYNGVVAAGYGNDPYVLLFNTRMQLLSRAVSERRLSDSDAIFNATDFALQLRTAEQAQIAQQNDAFLRALSQAATSTQNTGTSPPQNSPSRVVACIKLGDITRQIQNFYGIACPVGYAPAY
jgi:hypothetical protein